MGPRGGVDCDLKPAVHTHIYPFFLPLLHKWCLDLFLVSQDCFATPLLPAWSALANGRFLSRSKGDLLLHGGLAWIQVPFSLLPFIAFGLLSSWFEICPPFISIQAKVEKKTEAAAPARKPEPNAVTKAAGPIGNAQKPPTGKVSFI